MARKPKFSTLNRARKRPVDSSGNAVARGKILRTLVKCCSVMRLASEPTRVPAPPMVHADEQGCHAPVKWESSTAAGTLLMIWLKPGAHEQAVIGHEGREPWRTPLARAPGCPRTRRSRRRWRVGPSPRRPRRAGRGRRARRLRRRRRRRRARCGIRPAK